jgi:hypothetical protein
MDETGSWMDGSEMEIKEEEARKPGIISDAASPRPRIVQTLVRLDRAVGTKHACPLVSTRPWGCGADKVRIGDVHRAADIHFSPPVWQLLAAKIRWNSGVTPVHYSGFQPEFIRAELHYPADTLYTHPEHLPVVQSYYSS